MNVNKYTTILVCYSFYFVHLAFGRILDLSALYVPKVLLFSYEEKHQAASKCQVKKEPSLSG